MRAALLAAIVATLVLAASTTAHAATITVDSLDDTGAPGICVLRDAITAANTKQATNGCAAGSGNDTIVFSVTGTILLASTLPEVTDALLEIDGPGFPDITIDGGGKVQVMEVASGAELKLKKLAITRGFINDRGAGGGILNFGTLIVRNTTFSRNSAGSGLGGGGGGIYNFGGTLTVINSTFCDNTANDGPGGGILSVGTVTVTNSNFFGNSGGIGGGIVNGGNSKLTVTNSTFSGNSGSGIENGGTLTVTNSTFSGNSGEQSGGGIENGETLTVTNSTFSGNSGSLGGGIDNGGNATLTVTNSTFSDNSATGNTGYGGSGGGIFNGLGSRAIVKSTILADSIGGNCSDRSGGHSGIINAGYNISDDATCGFTKTGSANNGDGVDPLLSPAGLAQNGGLTETIALLAGSPAIDAIPLAACTDQSTPPKRISTDQRSFPRPDAGEQLCDIGAYEYQN
jgi:hypothetical protein